MGLLRKYLEEHQLDPMPDKHKKNLDKLEDKLTDNLTDTTKNFEDCLKENSAVIADVVGRASETFKDESLSVFGKLRIIVGLGIEVYQIVDSMSDCVVSEGGTPTEQHASKIAFGKDLTYFIWMTIDPLKNHVNWLPFKKTIEKWLVRWLAGYALETASDMLKADPVQTMSLDTVIIIKALPTR